MSFVSHLQCTACGARHPVDARVNLCLIDGRPLEMRLDLEALSAAYPSGSWLLPDRQDMWRYGALMPLDAGDPAEREAIVSLGEGWTPQSDWSDYAVAQRAGFTLTVKEEGIGHNPTGSFKDRGMAATVTLARQRGITRLAVPTQGNAGDALVSYARAAGLDVFVVLPDDTPSPIRSRIEAAAREDPRVQYRLIQGTVREAGKVVREELVPDGWFNVATFVEPGWRIEGKKSLGLELAEQMGEGFPWRLPDVIVYPTGGGTGILGMWKAFGELAALGCLTGPMPRMVCVQSDATAPLVDAVRSGAADSPPTVPGFTVATGLNVPGGVGHFRVLEIIRESGGTAIAVPEAAIEHQSAKLAPRGIGPEGAACLAALDSLVDSSMIRSGDRVVVFNTCGPDKYDTPTR